MSDDEQLELLPSPSATEPINCWHCGREMLVTKASLVAACEAVPRGRSLFDRSPLWIGVTAYVETPEHRVIRAVVATVPRPVDGPMRILCSVDCPGRDRS